MKVPKINLSEINWRLWSVFIACFAVSQIINPLSYLPVYESLQVMGVPLIFFYVTAGESFVYFNLIFLIIDMVVWYLVAKIIIYAYGEITKFRITG